MPIQDDLKRIKEHLFEICRRSMSADKDKINACKVLVDLLFKENAMELQAEGGAAPPDEPVKEPSSTRKLSHIKIVG